MDNAIARLKEVVHKVFRFIMVVLMACATMSCGFGDQNRITRVSRIVMGTLVDISAVGPPDKTRPAIESAFDELKRIEELTSFHKTSGLTELNGSSGRGPVKVDSELAGLIARSLYFSRISDGAFDPTIGPISRLWNFSGEGGPRLPEREEIEQALPLVDWGMVELDTTQDTVALRKEGMALDLGAIAKGYATDKAIEKLKNAGVEAALINAGGNILAYGEKAPGKPWKIGIQDPRNQSGIIAAGEIVNKAVVTSGDYERFFMKGSKRYHHLLDPRTGYPADDLQSVTIMANDGMTADALSTAVFVLGKEKGMALIESLPDVAGLMADAEGKILMSKRASKVFQAN